MKELPKIVIGVDPSMHENAFAWGLLGGVPNVASFSGLITLGRCTPLMQLGEAYSATHQLCAVIECPTWSGNGTKEVRAAAVQWEAELQRLFPKRRIHRVDPRVWQRVLLSGCPGADTKARSLFRAQTILNIPVETHDEADAVCIWEYAALIAENLMAPTESKQAVKQIEHERHQRRRASGCKR